MSTTNLQQYKSNWLILLVEIPIYNIYIYSNQWRVHHYVDRNRRQVNPISVVKPCWCIHLTRYVTKDLVQGLFNALDELSEWVLWYRSFHYDVIKWRYWPFVWGIHRSPVNSPHKRQWRGALMSSLICAWINGWVNNRKGGDLRRHRAHYDITVMQSLSCGLQCIWNDHNSAWLMRSNYLISNRNNTYCRFVTFDASAIHTHRASLLCPVIPTIVRKSDDSIYL